MAWWVLNRFSGTSPRQNKLGWWREATPNFGSFFNQVAHPFNQIALEGRVCGVNYASRAYVCGGYTDNWMIDEFYRAYRLGMQAPTLKPTLSTGAGAVVQIGYVSFYDAISGERSSLSVASAASTGNVTRTWGNLPTFEPGYSFVAPGTTAVNASTTVTGTGTNFTLFRVGDRISVSSAATTWAQIRSITSATSMVVDRALGDGTTQTINVKAPSRATHIELWVSVAGADPRLAARRALGTSAVTESTATLSLGEVAPDPFERFPRCSFAEIYHDRLAMAGDKRNPDTVYLSETFFPERYGGLSFKTRNGEVITALAVQGDSLMVFTPNSTYAIQGYDDDDMSMVLREADLGAMHHWAVAKLHGNLWVANDKAVFLYNGSFHNILRDRQTEWANDYRTGRVVYDTMSFSYINPEDQTYNFVCPNDTDFFSGTNQTFPAQFEITYAGQFSNTTYPPTGDTRVWVADYTQVAPEIGGTFQQPNWVNDMYVGGSRSDEMTCAAYLKVPGAGVGKIYTGWRDGYIRVTSQTALTDDSNTITVYIRTGHYYMGDPGGDIEEGREWNRLWSYVSAERDYLSSLATGTGFAWTIYILGGDSEAWKVNAPTNETNGLYYRESVPSSYLSTSDGTHVRNWCQKTVHWHVPERVTGRGITVIYTATGVGPYFKFRGFGGTHIPGPASRQGFHDVVGTGG